MSSRATFGARPAVRVGGRRSAARATRFAVRAETATKIVRAPVPLELEEGELPMNTFSPKAPFKATVKSVKVITGPGATGETCDIVIDTRGEIPYWEGQSYGVIPPVRALPPYQVPCCAQMRTSRCAASSSIYIAAAAWLSSAVSV